MMNTNNGFELHGLEKLFATDVNGVVDATPRLSNPDRVREYVVGEVARIRQRFLETVASLDGEDALRQYVRMHQYALVAILDGVHALEDEDLALSCYTPLMGLLHFLRDQFPVYIDDHAKVPLSFIQVVGTAVISSVERLEKELRRVSNSPELVYMVLFPLDRFCLAKKLQRISMHRVRHLMHILHYGITVKKMFQGKNDEPLIRLLLFLNYNSKRTVVQFREFLRIVVPSDMETRDKIERFERFLRIVNEATVKTDTGYHPDAPTLKSQLAEYLGAELMRLRGFEGGVERLKG